VAEQPAARTPTQIASAAAVRGVKRDMAHSLQGLSSGAPVTERPWVWVVFDIVEKLVRSRMRSPLASTPICTLTSGLASSATRWGDGPQHRRRALADGLEH
jgi:hypothetical protein